ncbi:Histidine kinase-like ATPase, ATP-binding domain-containing protein [Artemisia annua]|uniref:Histidine kinase-like ATPase, ATP-binding domain-containing protein n=1 Tax=Artemisia annua TaxID=35608 RepID=A0A2U1NRL8_ARTAN|nr:Histidine kinase-like ATPase, ATP-binding domain-containing protein [Artemisia annua]
MVKRTLGSISSIRYLPSLELFWMIFRNLNMVDAYWDDELGEVDTGLVKLGSTPIRITNDQIESQNQILQIVNVDETTQDSERNKSSSGSGTGHSGTYILDHGKAVVDASSPCSTTAVCGIPLCRQFWKAGTYDVESTPVSKTQVGSNYLHIHPKFLHSNATSHKWAFGAIAELLDNAVDEIQNGATCVMIDKTLNPRDGSPALLIQDNGSGMSPEAMRQCLSFGFSDKKSDSAIGKYGNGFKTSSMRLGADALVFSRHLVDGNWTQSIGLLSYTFLTQSGYDRIVVPMVHYKYNTMTHKFQSLQPASEEHSNSNLSVLLQWSPYSTEEELLEQCNFGHRGTKIIIYNLWLDDEGKMELDFDSDPEDIRIMWDGESKMKDKSVKSVSENHIANHLRRSLRAYLSILYIKLPETFSIRLRRKVVLYHNLARDLKYHEFISYKAHNGRHGRGGCNEGEVVTTIGFHKDAPNVKVHGFSIYHKRRLILPFLSVVGLGKGRGVVGVLEANYIEPTHNKQDFENTNVYQKLVTRLRQMTYEYWDTHCRAIGCEVPEKARPSSASHALSRSPQTPVGCSKSAPDVTTANDRAALNGHCYDIEPVELFPCLPQGSNDGSDLKRKLPDHPKDRPSKNIRVSPSVANTGSNMLDSIDNRKKMAMMQENKKLKDNCLEYEKVERELNLKVMELKTELKEAQREYAAWFTELQALERVKVERNRYIYV